MDGGKLQVPTLKVKQSDGMYRAMETNKGKGEVLQETFFLKPR